MGEILLDWEGHEKALSTKLWEFFNEEYLVDFNVTCHGQQKKVHKFVLAFLFPILKESLRSTDPLILDHGELKRNDKIGTSMEPQCLNLDNIAEHADDMNYLIQFAYTGKTAVPKEHTECMMRIAEAMEIQCLKDSLNGKIKKAKGHRNKETEQTINNKLERLRPRTRLKKVNVIEDSVDIISSNDDDDDDDDDFDFHSVADEESSRDSVQCSDSNDKRTKLNSRRTSQNRLPRKRRCENDHSKGKKPIKLIIKRAPEKLPKTDSKEEANNDGEPSNEQSTSPTSDKGKKLLKCPQCNYSASFPYLIDRHLKSHARKQAKAQKQFPCKLCKNIFESRNLLETHRDSKCGTDPLVCKYCGHSTSRRFILLQHMSAIHQVDPDGNPLEKNIKCPDCDFVCYADHQLRTHKRAKHERLGKFKCKECNFKAPYITQLVRHERITHQNIRNYMCDECGFRFQKISHLKRHVLVQHKGVKPYKCNVCNAEYSDSLSFKVHVQRHEGKVEYKFVCHICGHNLRRRFELRTHMRKKHGMELEDDLAKADNLDQCQSKDTNKPTS